MSVDIHNEHEGRDLDICMPVFITALSVTVKKVKQPIPYPQYQVQCLAHRMYSTNRAHERISSIVKTMVLFFFPKGDFWSFGLALFMFF